MTNTPTPEERAIAMWTKEQPESEYLAELTALIRERDEAVLHRSNLLCRIHRDGGHYLSAHGLDKAVDDADTIVAETYAERDGLKDAIKQLRSESVKHAERCDSFRAKAEVLDWLEKTGMVATPDKIWDKTDGESLLSAITQAMKDRKKTLE